MKILVPGFSLDQPWLLCHLGSELALILTLTSKYTHVYIEMSVTFIKLTMKNICDIRGYRVLSRYCYSKELAKMNNLYLLEFLNSSVF